MNTKRLATTLESGSASDSNDQADGFVSRITVNRDGLCSTGHQHGMSLYQSNVRTCDLLFHMLRAVYEVHLDLDVARSTASVL